MNEHARIEALLAIYRDLDEPERLRVERHLSQCPHCTERLQAYQAMDQALATLRARDLATFAPLQPGKALVEELAQARSRKRHSSWSFPLLRQVAGLSLLLLLTVGLLLLFSSAPPQPATPPLEDLPRIPTAALPTTPTVVVENSLPQEPEGGLTLCMASEPHSLLWAENSYATQAVLEAVQEPLVDLRDYTYQPNLVEQLPSPENGGVRLEEVTLGEGERFYDILSGSTVTLSEGIQLPFALAQPEGAPLVVESWDGNPLRTVQATARWQLVEGLSWEDGVPVSASDSVYTFELESDPAWRPANPLLNHTASYEAQDERTIVWQGVPGYLPEEYALYLWRPQPRHLLERIPAEELPDHERLHQRPLSYGPYKIDRWRPGVQIELSPNPHYVRGAPPLDRLLFRFMPHTEQLLSSLLAGECDLVLRDADWEGKFSLLQRLEEQKQLQILQASSPIFEHLDFNLLPAEGYEGAATTLQDRKGRLLFQNVAFRRAIAHCLDREAIIEEAVGGAARLQHSYLPSDHPLYPGDEALTLYPFDPTRGRQLLADLGWEDTDGDGILDDGAGTALSFTHSTRSSPLRERITRIVQVQLRDHCGIESQIELYGSEFFASGPEGLLFGRRFDMAQFAWLVGPQPPCTLYTSDAIPNEENGWQAANNSGFSHPGFDRACTAALQATDEEERAVRQAEALAIFTEQLPSIPLFSRLQITIARPDLRHVEVDATSPTELTNIEKFEIEP